MSIRSTMLSWACLGLFAVLAYAQEVASGDELRQLVESSRHRAFSATLSLQKTNTPAKRIEVFRRPGPQGGMLELRRYYKGGDSAYLTTYRLPEGYYAYAGGKLMKIEIGDEFKDEEEPALAWEWGWDAILRDLGAEFTVVKKPVTIGKRQYLRFTVTTPVTAANLAAISHKTEAEMEPKMEQLKARFPSVKELTVDEKENFIVMARMFSSTGRKVIELQWGKISYQEPAPELFALPDAEGKVQVIKTPKDMVVEVPVRGRRTGSGRWVQEHLVWILIGVAVLFFAGALAVKFRRR